MTTEEMLLEPSYHVRLLEDTNLDGFYDRSTGVPTYGELYTKPNQVRSASNQSIGASTRSGSLDTRFDVAGNLTDRIFRLQATAFREG